mmetsp:Transcript_29903/g.45872  ORF Transcript_29903/g.45872 Transcript_29903/m.45872 type:complete len:288 (+) Transcript_29903:82-945(+)
MLQTILNSKIVLVVSLLLLRTTSSSAFTTTTSTIHPHPIAFLKTQNLKSSYKNTLKSFVRMMSSTQNDNKDEATSIPKLIVFDLDGCLWRPEMYEILYYSRGRGAPFQKDPNNVGQLLTCGNEPVYLLGNVRDVMKQLHYESKWDHVLVGISSRTDEPSWAGELLTKFELHVEDGNEETVSSPSESATLADVFKGGPIEIAHDSKVQHFQRISQQTGIHLEDMLFFDNESGNCREVAKLGVTVAYTPDGVTTQMFDVACEAFPQTKGDVVGIDVYGYDSLEGASRFF